MADTIHNTIPSNFVDSEEVGVAAHYTFPQGMLSRFGYYKNQMTIGAGGADLSIRAGNPYTGEKYGLSGGVSTTSYWSTPGGTSISAALGFVVDYEMLSTPTAFQQIIYHGSAPQHQLRVFAGSVIPRISLNSGVTETFPAFGIIGRGRVHLTADHDGTNQRSWINGRVVAQNAAAFQSPGAVGALLVGRHGTYRRVVIPVAWNTPIRTRYVREFAKSVQWSWQPRIVGEGPAGGILTGATGEGGWYCPLGAATLGFAPITTLGGGLVLGLTDTVISMSRLDFMHARLPAFGSWLFHYKTRNSATDNPRFAIHDTRGVDFTAAGSTSYWVDCVQAAGVWRTTFRRENGAAQITVDQPLPAANTECAVLLTRHPSGDWRLYSWTGTSGWAGNPAVVANDITYLSSNYVSISPRGPWVLRATKYLGEMEPSELEIPVFGP